MTLLGEIDEAMTGRVLIFGSPPPQGRDLDLLVQPDQIQSLHEILQAVGFIRVSQSFARFGTCGKAEAVDVVDVTRWLLPEAEIRRIFDDATPFEAFSKICLPAPHDTLLILARRMSRGTELDERKRKRVTSLLRAHPESWTDARHHAPAWGLSSALALLEEAVAGNALTRPRRFQALREENRVLGGGSGRIGRAAASMVRRPRRGWVIALSGLDGAGKTTQAEHLQQTLGILGFEAVISWSRIARNPSLRALANPIKRVLNLILTEPPPQDPDPDGALRRYPEGRPPTFDAGKQFRSRSRILTYLWALVVAFANTQTHRKLTKQHIRRGQVVICDRYLLDSLAHLRRRYGPAKRFVLPRAIIRWLSPQPTRAYFLDVTPRTAYERKAEQYAPRDLEQQRALYLQEVQRTGAKKIDAERAPDEICRELGRDVWVALVTSPSRRKWPRQRG